MTLTDAEVGHIKRYAFRDTKGGWQRHLEAVFGDHLWVQGRTKTHTFASTRTAT